jgi:hypothetical protein
MFVMWCRKKSTKMATGGMHRETTEKRGIERDCQVAKKILAYEAWSY